MFRKTIFLSAAFIALSFSVASRASAQPLLADPVKTANGLVSGDTIGDPASRSASSAAYLTPPRP